MPATSKKRYHPTSDSNRISKSRRDVNGGDLSTPGRRTTVVDCTTPRNSQRPPNEATPNLSPRSRRSPSSQCNTNSNHKLDTFKRTNNIWKTRATTLKSFVGLNDCQYIRFMQALFYFSGMKMLSSMNAIYTLR